MGTKAYEVTAFSTLVQLLLTVEAVQRHWQKKVKVKRTSFYETMKKVKKTTHRLGENIFKSFI